MHHQAPSLARSRLGRLGGWAADHRRPIALVCRATDPRRGSLEQLAGFFRENAPEGMRSL